MAVWPIWPVRYARYRVAPATWTTLGSLCGRAILVADQIERLVRSEKTDGETSETGYRKAEREKETAFHKLAKLTC
jgi:hypothetical protein